LILLQKLRIPMLMLSYCYWCCAVAAEVAYTHADAVLLLIMLMLCYCSWWFTTAAEVAYAYVDALLPVLLLPISKEHTCVLTLSSLLQSHNQTHCFGLKWATTTPPPALHSGGIEGCFVCSPEDFLNKNVNFYSYFHQKLVENDVFMETPQTKKFARIFS
jgi:hypothetical protein